MTSRLLSWLIARDDQRTIEFKPSTTRLAEKEHLLTTQRNLMLDRVLHPLTFVDIRTGWQHNLVRPDIQSPARAELGALRVVDANIYDRYMGEHLVDDYQLLVQAAGPSVAWETRGYQYMFVTMNNPTWATNPTGLTCFPTVSTDDFDTEIFQVLGLDGVAIVQNCLFGDLQQYAFYIPTMSNAGAVAVTNTPVATPIPDIDGMTMRLDFVPVGAAITGEAVVMNVYGITSR